MVEVGSATRCKERQMSRPRDDTCGCRAGAIGVLAAGSLAAVWSVFIRDGLRWPQIAVAAAAVLGAGPLGKLAALTVVRRRKKEA